jgi:arylsulfatase A-like enzyme
MLASLGSLACFVCTLVACRSGEPEDRPRDIVLILIDTLRRDALSPYGAATETPTVQGLADAGQVFTNAEGSFHQTTMSMGALFTGRTPSIESAEAGKTLAWNGRHWCGMARFSRGEDDSCIPGDLPTLAEQLRDAGYWTAGIVSNRLLFAPAGYEQGFDTWIEVSAGRTDLTTAQLAIARSAGPVNEAVRNALDGRPDQPAFVYVPYVDVHDRMVTDDDYASAVARLDGQLAQLLEILDDEGLRENRVVFLTSDHGENLGEQHANYLARGHIGNPSFQPVL